MIKIIDNLFIILAIFICGAVFSLTSEAVSEKWADFKTTYRKTYINTKEESYRIEIFKKKLHSFKEHNERFRQGLETYEVGINQFADLTDEEIKLYNDGFILPKSLTEVTSWNWRSQEILEFIKIVSVILIIHIIRKPSFDLRTAMSIVVIIICAATVALSIEVILEKWEDLSVSSWKNEQEPPSFDWRDQGIITPVKNQGICRSCWAFSATGAVEAPMKRVYGPSLYGPLDISLSEQQLFDCVINAAGCTAGTTIKAFTYMTGGIEPEVTYAYEGKNGSCHYRSDELAVQIKGYVYLETPDENMLMRMVATKGPVSVTIYADGSFNSYTGGVYYNRLCKSYSENHAVLIVGYGNENGQDYWLVKNSWGDKWGQNGYIKMARNRNNHCGIANYASYPIL